MPVSYLPSAEQLVDRQKTTAKKRRRNQNAEIDELAKLLPIKPLPLSATTFPESELPAESSSAAVKANQAVDKISVLRITSTFLKFQEFLGNSGYLPDVESASKRPKTASLPSDLLAEAMDGFLIALDKDATILYASESITSYIGLTQHDVIGQCLEDITHPDDEELIKDNLTPKATLPPGITNKSRDTQPRQFYIRFKSTMSPGRVQLSRFNSYTMIQVTGNLKVRNAESGTDSGTSDSGQRKEAVGFVGECRLIESTASILEISIPQSHFTTTISMEMKIVSVESQMKELIGFSAEEFVGTRLRDYFHPADYTKLIPCEVMLMHTGHAVSPVFRFMSASGGWVWMQMEGILRYKPGTKERQFWEIKVKMVSQEEGHIALIEQNELYTPNPDPNQDLLNPHKDRTFLAKLKKAASSLCRGNEGAEPILRSLRNANLSGSLINSVLHGREMGLSELPGNVKQVLKPNQADDFRVQLRKSLDAGTWGKTDLHFDGFEHVCRSPQTDLASVASPTPSTLSSTLTSDPSVSGLAPPTQCYNPTPPMVGNHTHSEFNPQPPTNQPISYYPGCSQGASPYNSPQPSPVPSSMLYGHHDVRSPPGSGVPSPTPSSNVGVSASPASSSVHSGQRSHNGGRAPVIMSSAGPNGYYPFQYKPADSAISATFGGNPVPNFSATQFQPAPHGSDQVPVPGMDAEVSVILNDFHDPSGKSEAPVVHSQNWNGDGGGDEFLQGFSEDVGFSKDIKYYTPDGEPPHQYHMMSGDITVSSAAVPSAEGMVTVQGAPMEVEATANNANGPSDPMDQFISHLINS